MKPNLFVLILACCLGPCALDAQKGTAILTGLVQDPAGAGIGGDYVSVVLESETGAPLGQAHPDERGVFQFSGLDQGTYALTIRAPGFDAIYLKQQIRPGERRSLPPLRLNMGSSACFSSAAKPERTIFLSSGASAGVLSGKVRSEGQPIGEAQVKLECWLAQECQHATEITKTNSEGGFRFDGIRPGHYLLSIIKDGFLSLIRMGFVVTGGLESDYLFDIAPCADGDCAPRRDNPKVVVCE